VYFYNKWAGRRGTLKIPEGEKIVTEVDAIVIPTCENEAHQLIDTSDISIVHLEVKTAKK